MEASHARMSEAEILAARDWADEEADENGLLPLSDEGYALVRRAETLLSGSELEEKDRQSLVDILARIEDAQAGGEPEDLEALLDRLEDVLFDLEVD